MFGFSSYSCYTCFFLDKDSVKGDTGWCNEKRKWITLTGPACKSYESFYLCTYALANTNDKINTKDLYTLYTFRNKYIAANKEGKEVLEEYKVLGQVLVNKIKNDPYKSDIVTDIKDNYVIPMLNYIKNDNFIDAQTTFINMFNNYKKRYGYEPVKLKK